MPQNLFQPSLKLQIPATTNSQLVPNQQKQTKTTKPLSLNLVFSLLSNTAERTIQPTSTKTRKSPQITIPCAFFNSTNFRAMSSSARSRKSFLIDSLLEERQRQLALANQSSSSDKEEDEEEPAQLDAFNETEDDVNESGDHQADVNGNEQEKM
jgi:hypothetical protein